MLRPKRFLLGALKIAKLPHSYPTLIKYENSGLLPKSVNGINVREDSNYRLYTDEEILSAVAKIMSHKHPGKAIDIEKINEKIIKFLNA